MLFEAGLLKPTKKIQIRLGILLLNCIEKCNVYEGMFMSLVDSLGI